MDSTDATSDVETETLQMIAGCIRLMEELVVQNVLAVEESWLPVDLQLRKGLTKAQRSLWRLWGPSHRWTRHGPEIQTNDVG